MNTSQGNPTYKGISFRVSLNWVLRAILVAALCLLLADCQAPEINRELAAVENAKNINLKHQYLKVHLLDGKLYVLHQWKVDDPNRMITGYGNLLDANRRLLTGRGTYPNNEQIRREKTGAPFAIPYEDIVLVETNDKGTNPGVAAMVVAGLATVSFGILCAVNPKACFGSCPTFYVDHGDSLKLVGEGFSSSICKSLEATDVDRIDSPVDPQKEHFYLTMKNEAWETHLIRRVNLLMAPRSEGNRVLRDNNGKYFEVSGAHTPLTALYDGRSISKRINQTDALEWYSLADSSDLLEKEEVDLEFDHPGGEVGLAIVNRQTLLTTFLFYHSLSLLGHAAGYYYQQMETGSPWIQKGSRRIYELLGGIEVGYRNEQGAWKWIASINEQGPIAEDHTLIRLPASNAKRIQLKLRITKGLWRINSLQLVSIVQPVQPIRLPPVMVTKNQVEDTVALRRLTDASDHLVTYPGEDYRILYKLPGKHSADFFIEAEGYYIEWMRDEWLPEENLAQAKTLFLHPREYLKSIAPAYKAREPEMEHVFWNSRYTKR